MDKISAKQLLLKLSPEEQREYIKLNKIFNSNLNEDSSSFKKGLSYLTKNWKNYSLAMLTALMINPNISNALNRYSPETFDAIKTEISVNSDKGVGTGEETGTDAEGNKTYKMVMDLDFSQTFESGKSSINKANLQKKIQEVQNFLQNKKAANYKIKIISGESQVTNPSNYGKGDLAKERANNVKLILNKFGFKDIETETKIGNTPYEKGTDNPQDSKYAGEQFVKVEIYINTLSLCSLNQKGSFKGGQGSKQEKYVSYTMSLSGEGAIIVSTGTIPDRVVLTNQNGVITKDLGFVTTKKSQYVDWRYVPLYVSQLTKLYNDKEPSVQSKSLRKIKVNSYEELVSKLLIDPNNKSYESNKREIFQGLKQLEEMFASGVREFILYDNLKTDKTLEFSEAKGDFEVVVYSPLGDTGFELQGKCK